MRRGVLKIAAAYALFAARRGGEDVDLAFEDATAVGYQVRAKTQLFADGGAALQLHLQVGDITAVGAMVDAAIDQADQGLQHAFGDQRGWHGLHRWQVAGEKPVVGAELFAAVGVPVGQGFALAYAHAVEH